MLFLTSEGASDQLRFDHTSLPKVENPIAFSPSALSRWLSTLHLHARYAVLLFWPRHLSADWSFECVPLVERLGDARNALSLALYAGMLLVLLMAQPWALPAEWLRAGQQQGGGRE